jgi:hypothetical protein
LVPEFEAVLVRQVQVFDPLFIHLSVSASTFQKRCSLPDLSVGELYALYGDIHSRTVETLGRLSLRHALITNDGTRDDLHGQINQSLRREAMHAAR